MPTTTQNLTIRDYRPEDLQASVRIHNAYYDDMPTTEEQRLHDQEVRPAELEMQEIVGEIDGEVALSGACLKAIWCEEKRRQFVQYSIDPRYSGSSFEREFFIGLCELARSRGCSRILTSLADKHPHHVRTVESEGFACQQRQPVTAVDPREFDPAVYAPLVEQLEREGIAIRTLESFEREGVEWLRPFYEMHCEIIQDVPMPEAFQPIPFDMFAKEVQDPKRYTLESKFVAVDGGRMVGVSELQANKADATVGHTMLTGVRRTHRRRKIATALKAAALGWAKSKGMRYVMTDNEEKNPMLDLNKQLGFRERYAFLQYAKDVD